MLNIIWKMGRCKKMGNYYFYQNYCVMKKLLT